MTARLTALLLGLVGLGLVVGSMSAASLGQESAPAAVDSVSVARANGAVTAS